MVKLKTRIKRIWNPIWRFLNTNKMRGRIVATILITALALTGLLVAFNTGG